MSLNNQSIQGNLSVSRDITVGGRSTIRGNSVFGHNVIIKGWLDAKNIKGPCKGLYASVDKLEAAYPEAMPGWYALVGDTLPADVYRAEGGEWVPTGEKGGEINLYLDQIENDIEEIYDDIIELQTFVSDGILVSDSLSFSNDATTVTMKYRFMKPDGSTQDYNVSVPVVSEESAGMMSAADKKILTRTVELAELDFDSQFVAKILTVNAPCLFIVTNNKKSCGVLDVFGDDMGHMLTQVFKTHYKVENGILTTTHSDNEIFQYYRSYHIVEGGTSDIPVGTWGEWKEIKSGSTGADISELTDRVTEIEKEIWPLNVELNIAPNIVEANTVNEITLAWNATLRGNGVNAYCKFTLNDEPITGTSKKLTINESIPTTKAFKLVATYNDRTNQVSSNLYVVGAMYFGFSNESSNANLVLTNLVKQSLKTSPIGTYTLQNLESGNYMWLCVPDNMSINDVTLNGFNVPMEASQDKQQGNITYRCYRSNHALIQGSYKVKIS